MANFLPLTIDVMIESGSTQDYTDELRVALELAREAGAAILDFYRGPLKIEQKYASHDSEPVTQADRVANHLIVERLRQDFPDDGILAEESEDTARRLGKLRVWMVDPLDGTTGFIAGNGDFAVQIGLAEAGKSVLGVVYQPLTGVLYRAVRGQGAWVERPNQAPEKAVASIQTDLSSMRLAASRSHRSPRMDQVVKAFGVKEEVRRGSVGIKVGLIVEQQCDLYIHLSPRTKQWDTCAPEVILTEAGGLLTDLFGRPLSYNVPEVQNRNGIVASNGPAHNRIISTLAPLLAEFHRLPV
ncbi:MAG TPA: 3'(2'),5'-bisphosphate nucleotidase CysQ [Pyrinomonadaceae bacterium]|nr:3'(2'),5'-bisphosphate nucleotidase CysQ [Pyrinomonadaceae bacterium]